MFFKNLVYLNQKTRKCQALFLKNIEYVRLLFGHPLLKKILKRISGYEKRKYLHQYFLSDSQLAEKAEKEGFEPSRRLPDLHP